MNEINDPADMFLNFIEKHVMDLGGKGGTQLFLESPDRTKRPEKVLKNSFLSRHTLVCDPNALTG